MAVDQSTVRPSQHRDRAAVKGTVMRRMSSERGAALMNVILGIVLLIGINTFVVDYGVMWVGRGAAQNAADAGALAGAVAMAFDDYNDRSDTGLAKTSAWKTSQENYVWGSAPKVDITTDVTFPKVPADPCADDSCIRVDVYRNVAGGNPLPVLFGTAIGLNSQGVRAMAIARAGAANASDCIKPFGIPDKWLDHFDDPANSATVDADAWTGDDYFDWEYPKKSKLGTPGNPIPVADRDVYVPPSKNSTGTGFTLANDLGTFVTLKYGSPTDTASPGNYLPIDLPLPGGGMSTGASDMKANIVGCNSVAVGVGDVLQSEPGGMAGPIREGIKALIAKDPTAQWDPSTKSVINSCVPNCALAPGAQTSPRIVAIPIFDTSVFETGRANGRVDLKLVNVLGFFVNDVDNGAQVAISGWLTTVPGLFDSTKAVLNNDSGFAKVVMLVR